VKGPEQNSKVKRNFRFFLFQYPPLPWWEREWVRGGNHFHGRVGATLVALKGQKQEAERGKWKVRKELIFSYVPPSIS
jgi:hypothetical protein